jgi:hypothetical protein
VQPTIGRTVIYKITEGEAQSINRRRTDGIEIAKRIAKNTPENSAWPLGAQAHIGNSAYAEQEFPLVIVRVWPDEYGPGIPGVNGQVFLDGNDVLWITSAAEGTAVGQWHWPERV